MDIEDQHIGIRIILDIQKSKTLPALARRHPLHNHAYYLMVAVGDSKFRLSAYEPYRLAYLQNDSLFQTHDEVCMTRARKLAKYTRWVANDYYDCYDQFIECGAILTLSFHYQNILYASTCRRLPRLGNCNPCLMKRTLRQSQHLCSDCWEKLCEDCCKVFIG